MPKTSSDSELMAHVHTYLLGSTNPDFVAYREQTLGRELLNEDRHVWFTRYLCNLGGFSGKTILDVGCGCGLHALTVSLIGGNRVVAFDSFPALIDGVKECVQFVRTRGVPDCRVEPMLGDVCELDLPPRSFDGIYSFKRVEQVRDIDRMFDRCVALLRPGGKFVVVLGGNVLNPAVREETRALWDKRERSWEFANHLRGLRPIEHADSTPFRAMRENIVRKANPDLDATAIDALVDATAGMLKPDIEELARKYRPGDGLPTVPHDWCRDPVTGEYTRRLLSPFDLAHRMRQRGLRARVHHAFRRLPLRLLNSARIRPVNMVLFRARPLSVIVGEAARNGPASG